VRVGVFITTKINFMVNTMRRTLRARLEFARTLLARSCRWRGVNALRNFVGRK